MAKKKLKFNKEIWTLKYWLHLLVISVIVFTILHLWQGGDMFSIKNILISVPILAVGDIVAHNLLKLD